MSGPNPTDKKTYDKYLAVAQTVGILIAIQTALIADFSLFSTKKDPNVGAMGYIYGFVDCALQTARLELNNEYGRILLKETYDIAQEGVADLVMMSLGPLTRGHKEFFNASMAGGNDYLNWVNGNGKFTPVGLGKFYYK